MATDTQTRYTPEDLLDITDRPMPELVDGRLIERDRGQLLDSIACRAAVLIGNEVFRTGAGLMNGPRCGFRIFKDDPDKVRVVNASFTRSERLPNGPAEGHATVAPDLIVEVISPKLLARVLESKVVDFLKAGVSLIWILGPASRIVQVYRRDHTGVRLFPGDVLDGEDILPGFRCDVAALFA